MRKHRMLLAVGILVFLAVVLIGAGLFLGGQSDTGSALVASGTLGALEASRRLSNAKQAERIQQAKDSIEEAAAFNRALLEQEKLDAENVESDIRGMTLEEKVALANKERT